MKLNLAESKVEVDKIDVDKLKTVPVDLSKLSNVANNDVKKTLYDKLVPKVNAVDTSRFVLKTKYDIDKLKLVKEIVMQTQKYLILMNLLKNRWNARIENKIRSISGLVTNASLSVVENTIPDVTNLFKKKIIMQKYQMLNLNALTQLIIMTLLRILLLII